jgi:hypothetical protein
VPRRARWRALDVTSARSECERAKHPKSGGAAGGRAGMIAGHWR